jgi:hypothetical protein
MWERVCLKEDGIGRACRIMVGKLEGKRPLERSRRRWVNNIQIYLKEIGSDGMDWIDLARDRDQWRALVNTVMNFRFPKNGGKFLNSCTIDIFSRRAQLHKELSGKMFVLYNYQ